jgi:threonine synthase
MTTMSCNDCSNPLEVSYSQETLDESELPLPFKDRKNTISIGEGHTPSVSLTKIGKYLNLRHLSASLEYLNPTGSFKDRGTAVMLNVAAEFGTKEIVEDSSGNAGASVAAYASRHGMKAHIFVPDSAPVAKLRQIIAYGAEVHSISGHRHNTTTSAIKFCKDQNLIYASHNLSPYFLEGTKTYAYEIASGNKKIPDHMVFPVGNGSLFIGTWIGFSELARAGLLKKVPRMHCVQPQAVMPVVAKYRGEIWDPRCAMNTVAGGISVTHPPRCKRILKIINESNGTAIAVKDPDILTWGNKLAHLEGIYAEPTSAAALAGLEQLVRTGTVKEKESVLIPITGFGLKDVAS